MSGGWGVLVLVAVVSACVGAAVTFAIAARRRHAEQRRIQQLCAYLEAASIGNASVLVASGEDDISKLQDEMSKTVSALHRTQAAAIEAKENYAHNMSNIAHQLKTPLAAISLAAQQMRADPSEQTALLDRIDDQVARIDALQSDLLLLARIDAGVLDMHLVPQDVLSLLSIAAESLEELASDRGVHIVVQDNGAVQVLASEHWMHEALVNLLKNCLEHAPAGSIVRAEYEENPLYVQIRISDEGPGFSSEDIKHVFQRFYKGANSAPHSTGLGLAFARELLEFQDGTIQARDLPEGGACFDIRIYRHPKVTLPS